ncbi:hypothetical protein CCP3SC15_300007 [Gammaproteobacteria bacterium]
MQEKKRRVALHKPSQKKKARQANRKLFTERQGEANRDFLNPAKVFKKRSIGQILNLISREVLPSITTKAATTADPAATALLFSQYKIAVRDNMEPPSIHCPQCQTTTVIPAVGQCKECGTNVDFTVPNIAMENNSIKAAQKLLDKMYPNLQHNDNTINFEGAIISISGEIARIIVQYVPAAERKKCINEIENLFQKVQNSFDAAAEPQI